MTEKLSNRKNNRILLILTFGVFGIINTEMGVVGLLPMLSEHFSVSISKAGLFVSLFALVVALAGPIMPLLFSGIDRKKMMIMALSAFLLGNIVQAFTSNFILALVARTIPALLHPVYISQALTFAGGSVAQEESSKAVAKVMVGVSAGMVLGVPIVSFVANATNLRMGMLVFALVNALALIATIFMVPPMKVENKMTYGEQLSVLKMPMVWISIIGIILLNGSIFGVYSYVAEYLDVVTGISNKVTSTILLVYGLANIVGNIIAGKGLGKNATRFVVMSFFPTALIYICLLVFGKMTFVSIFIISLWGIMAGIIANINQYWIVSITEEAPEFGNGLFLAATNLGTTIGTTICGAIIGSMGISFVVLGGLLLLVSSFVMIMIRVGSLHK